MLEGLGLFLFPWIWEAPEASACLREHPVIAGRRLCSGYGKRRWKRWEGQCRQTVQLRLLLAPAKLWVSCMREAEFLQAFPEKRKR